MWLRGQSSSQPNDSLRTKIMEMYKVQSFRLECGYYKIPLAYDDLRLLTPAIVAYRQLLCVEKYETYKFISLHSLT